MILNWDDFEAWRINSLEYHKRNDEHEYTSALTFFEYARRYFDSEGFPPEQKITTKGNIGKWTINDSIQQKRDIHDWIRKNL